MMAEEFKTEFSNLCLALNMDEQTKQHAFKKYERSLEFKLEGKPIYWFACALYDCCFSRSLITLGGECQRGNYISVTQLLRSIELSFEEFIQKYLYLWQVTANNTEEFRKHVDNLRRKWVVTSQIYNKYKQIFSSMVREPEANFKTKRSKKIKREITSLELFKFIWTFYCNVKSAFPNSIDEVLSSTQLLLAVTDYCFGEVMLTDSSLLSENGRNAFKQTTSTSIVDRLCQEFIKMDSTETKRIRDYHLKPLIKQYFIQSILKAGLENDKGIFEGTVFDTNVKTVTNEYDTHILKLGEYDNRLFLEGTVQSVRTPGDRTPSKQTTVPRTPSELSNKAKKNLFKAESTTERALVPPPTPFSNRKYLPEEEKLLRTPISEQADIMNRLNNLIVSYSTRPNTDLEKILSRFEPSVKTNLIALEHSLSEKFVWSYCNGEPRAEDFARLRLEHGVRLFYRLFECIVKSEASRCGNIALKNVISNVDFISATFAMSLEIVLNSYGSSDRKFPWILGALNLHAFFVARVIETIIMHDTGLSRTIIKHLNSIEETMLESMVWSKDSPLFEQLAECAPPRPPKYETVKPSKGHGTPNPRIPRDRKRGITPLTSNHSPFEHLDKQQCVAPGAGVAAGIRAVPNLPSGGHHHHHPEPSTPREGGAQTPVSALASTINNLGVMSPPPRPAVKKSLQMFFRKVYNLASLRISNLCERLGFSEEVMQKIWTVFEYALTSHVHLFYERHLDQVMMSACYLIVKAENLSLVTFKQIIECYREQPQVNDKQYIYRSVLLKTSPLPPVLQCACPLNHDLPEHGDVIKFYNAVFIPHISSFVRESSIGTLNLTAPLSPMPTFFTPTHVFSPRRIDPHNISVSPKRASAIPAYVFGESPTKHVEALNSELRSNSDRRVFFKEDAQWSNSSKIKTNAQILRYDS